MYFSDSSTYAHYVFNAFDQDRSGSISFEEFVTGLSLLARGSLHEKLEWAFNLYDINGNQNYSYVYQYYRNVLKEHRFERSYL